MQVQLYLQEEKKNISENENVNNIVKNILC